MAGVRLRTEAEYQRAAARLQELALRLPLSEPAELEEYELLLLTVADFERRSRIADQPLDPIEAIEACLEHRGLTQEDLSPLLGTVDQVAAIMSGRLPLTLEMVQLLHERFQIPAEALIGRSRPTQKAA